MEKSKKGNTLMIKIIVILFIILMIFLIYNKIQNDKNNVIDITSEIFSKVDKKTYVKVTKYIIYGTHFNIEGTISIPKISGIDIEKNSSYLEGILSFSSITELNSGLNLEKLDINSYYIFVKVTFTNSDIKYYSLLNDTKYEYLTYYTLTKQNRNNKIDIGFDKYNDISCMTIDVQIAEELPKHVYDIVIDPGHGGADSGATYKNYKESDIVLDCAKSLKSKLEEIGLKVLLTRQGLETASEYNAYSMYNTNGRVTIANESNAKILISLHLNSENSKTGGVEVYAPSKCNLDLAKLIAKNIVKYAKTSYSKVNTYKKANGVYVHSFNNAEILAYKQSAILKGFEPYNITTDTPFLYIIREIGGICTNAFVDGRNTLYSANKYVDSNIGIEGYSIDLGYIRVQNDLNNIVNKKDSYMQAICNSISEFYGIE